jgi:hypothetical protein
MKRLSFVLTVGLVAGLASPAMADLTTARIGGHGHGVKTDRMSAGVVIDHSSTTVPVDQSSTAIVADVQAPAGPGALRVRLPLGMAKADDFDYDESGLGNIAIGYAMGLDALGETGALTVGLDLHTSAAGNDKLRSNSFLRGADYGGKSTAISLYGDFAMDMPMFDVRGGLRYWRIVADDNDAKGQILGLDVGGYVSALPIVQVGAMIHYYKDLENSDADDIIFLVPGVRAPLPAVDIGLSIPLAMAPDTLKDAEITTIMLDANFGF